MPGPSKLIRPWGDTTVLGSVVRAARAAGLDPVVVVGRPGADLSGAEEADRRVAAPAHGGRADSLATGLAALEPGSVVVLLGDEPGVEPGVVRSLVEACSATGIDAGRIRYSDRPGHPVWLGPAARAVAMTLTGETPVWEAVAEASLRTLVVKTEQRAPIDVDSPADLERARRRRGGPVA